MQQYHTTPNNVNGIRAVHHPRLTAVHCEEAPQAARSLRALLLVATLRRLEAVDDQPR